MMKGHGTTQMQGNQDHQRRHVGATPTCSGEIVNMAFLLATPLFGRPVHRRWSIIFADDMAMRVRHDRSYTVITACMR